MNIQLWRLLTKQFFLANEFSNGFAKSYCRELSDLCSQDIFRSGTESRSTVTDDLKLITNVKETSSKKSSMFLRRRSLTIESKITISSPSYASGDRTCDCMVLSGLQFALVIFECKSSTGNSDFVQGLIHVVSHGLALRHKKQVAHEMKHVMLMLCLYIGIQHLFRHIKMVLVWMFHLNNLECFLWKITRTKWKLYTCTEKSILTFLKNYVSTFS